MAFSFSICVPLLKLLGSPATICLMGNYTVALEVCVGGGASLRTRWSKLLSLGLVHLTRPLPPIPS